MIGHELADKIRESITNIFPNSFVDVHYSTNLCESVIIRFALGNESEWSYGIIQNDPAFNTFFIYQERDGLTLSASCIGLRDRATYKTDKLGWRDIKKGTTDDKIVAHIEKYFWKLADKTIGRSEK